MHTLYLCYFGLREPLVQTQVLPYLRELMRDGVRVTLLTFEPDRRRAWTDEAAAEWTEALAAEGIRWTSLPYHKRPSLPATVYDILVGAAVAARIVRRDRIDVLHGRSHVATAMGALAKAITGARLVFDIRGFNAEEYVDAGRWRAGGLKFRLTKRAERAIFPAADGFVVLTERARDILFPAGLAGDGTARPVEVIPCCVDLNRFAVLDPEARDRSRRELGLDGRRGIVYLGALGGWYMTAEMADFFATAVRQDPTTKAIILTQSPPEMMAEPLRRRGVAESDFLIRKVVPADVPFFLAGCDVALSFITPCYSKISSSPTKMAEYLASGLPVVCTAGIGDVDQVVTDDQVGVLVHEMNEASYLEALRQVDKLQREGGLAERCRATAQRRFDLESVGGVRYRRLYRRIFEGAPNGASEAAGGR